MYHHYGSICLCKIKIQGKENFIYGVSVNYDGTGTGFAASKVYLLSLIHISIVISVFLICIVSYVLLGNLSRKFAIQANQEAVRQKNEDISGRVNGIEVTIRDIIYNSELQKLLNERNMEEGQESKDVYGMRMAVNSSIARASSSLYMIDNIAVFAKDGSMIGSLYEFNTLKKSAEYSLSLIHI